MKVAIITASTAIYRGREKDLSGQAIEDIMKEAGHSVIFRKPLPCDKEVLFTILQRMTDAHLTDLILTTGGAGCGREDCMPEVTMELAERLVPGIPEAIRAYSMQLTKRAMLNRSAAGIRGDVLIVNLPGKVNAVQQVLKYLLPEIIHAAELIKPEVKH